MVTRQDFERVADYLRQAKFFCWNDKTPEEVNGFNQAVDAVAAAFKTLNPNFNSYKFYTRVDKGHTENG